MKKLLSLIIIFTSLLIPVAASAQLSTQQGGTGTTSPSGILYGDGTLHLKTVGVGSGLTFSGGTLSASGGGTGTVTQINTTFPITGGPITTTGTLAFGGLSTSTAAVIGNLPYFSGVNTFANIATTTHSFSGPFTISGTLGTLVGGTNSTVTWNGLATTSQPASSNLLVSNGGAGVYAVATSSPSIGSDLTYSGTLGAFVGGASGSFALNLTTAHSWTGLQQFTNASSTQFTCTTCYLTLGGNLAGGGFLINNIGAPVSGGDATNKTYVDNAIAGVNPAVAVKVATTQASDTSGLTYSNGVSGIGATFTGSNNTALTFDGVTLTSLAQRVLVKNDTQSPSGAFNGVYYLTQLQTAILPPILTRALDYDMPSDINNTGAIPVTSGTVNGSTTWVITSSVTTVGTDPLNYTQFSLNPTTIFTTAGTGLTGTGSNSVSFAAIAANSLWVNKTGASAVPTVIATSSLFFNAGASSSGLLTSTDWNTFNNKGSGSVTSITAGTGLLGGAITTSGTINSIFATSTTLSISGIPYVTNTGATTGTALFGNVATTSLAVGTSLTVTSGTLGAQLGGANVVLDLALGHSNTWTVLQTFNGNASSTNLSSNVAQFGGTATTTFAANGEQTGYDAANLWSGRTSPTRRLIMNAATSTATWTGTSTPGVDASAPVVIPFTGTLQDAYCNGNTFLGVKTLVNGSVATPSYFISSTTIGTEKYTAGNTFTKGQLVQFIFGTTTSATASAPVYASCTLDMTETP